MNKPHEEREAYKKFLVSTNMYRKIDKSKVFKSLGVYQDKGFDMFIFTITENFDIICEINMKNFNDDFWASILDLLGITEHLYLYEVWELRDQTSFSNVWINLLVGLINYGSENKLRSIHFLPYSHKEVIKGTFCNKTCEIISPWVKQIQKWTPKIKCVFENFDFRENTDLEWLLNVSQCSSIKFFYWKLNLNIWIEASYLKPSDTYLCVRKWDFNDIDGLNTDSLVSNIVNLYREGPTKPYKLLLNLKKIILLQLSGEISWELQEWRHPSTNTYNKLL